jgi:hypothetical protein
MDSISRPTSRDEDGRFAAIESGPTRSGLTKYYAGRGIPLWQAQRLADCYINARKSAPDRRIAFTLHPEGVAIRWHQHPNKCALTGIRFAPVNVARAFDRQPWSPSIDRINCAQGYTYDNIRIVCQAVNTALNSWGESVLERIAEAVVIRKLRHVEGYAEEFKNRRRARSRAYK